MLRMTSWVSTSVIAVMSGRARFQTWHRRQAFCVLSPTGSVVGCEVSATQDLASPPTPELIEVCARASAQLSRLSRFPASAFRCSVSILAPFVFGPYTTRELREFVDEFFRDAGRSRISVTCGDRAPRAGPQVCRDHVEPLGSTRDRGNEEARGSRRRHRHARREVAERVLR